MASKTLVQTSIFLAPATALFMAGFGGSAGQAAVAQLYSEPPQVSTPIFARIFRSGGQVAIPLSLASSAFSAYLAYLCKAPNQRRLYLYAAVSMFSSLPWTLLVMMPGIKRLIAISESVQLQVESEGTGEHEVLLKRWVAHNYVRVALSLSSGAAGLWAAIFG